MFYRLGRYEYANFFQNQKYLDAPPEHFLKFYSPIFVGCYIATILVYGYFFTHVGFTNHTFPNVWQYPYPSFKTKYEGRWFADIIIQLTGGSGVPTLQIALASAIQIFNAFLFSYIFKVSNRLVILLISLFIALHPAFLDYYSFSVDHVSFVLGDTLALAGVLALDRLADNRTRLAASTTCFVLTLATYQPKIALIGILLVTWNLIKSIQQREPETGKNNSVDICLSCAAFFSALILYYVTVYLTVNWSTGNRQQVDSAREIIEQIFYSYPQVFSYFTNRVDYLPSALKAIPGLLILSGVLSIIVNCRRDGMLQRFRLLRCSLLYPRPCSLLMSSTTKRGKTSVGYSPLTHISFARCSWQRCRGE